MDRHTWLRKYHLIIAMDDKKYLQCINTAGLGKPLPNNSILQTFGCLCNKLLSVLQCLIASVVFSVEGGRQVPCSLVKRQQVI